MRDTTNNDLDGFAVMKADDGYYDAVAEDAEISVSEWANKNRNLPQGVASELGLWRTERTPYLREIMDALSSSSPIEKIVLMKGAQIGATETGLNWIGYIIDQAPGPILVVQPNISMAEKWSKRSITPLFELTEALRGKVKEPRSRDSGNTIQSKLFLGGEINIVSAESKASLRSMSAQYLFLDEVDVYPADAGGEGDPISLALRRASNFPRKKIFMASTPTNQGSSRIEKEFLNTDQRFYYIPCPHCGHYQVLKWMQIRWNEATLEDVHYECIECHEAIYDRHKTAMLAAGEWRATNPNADKKVAGYHLSRLYAPVGWGSWEDLVREYVEKKNDDYLLKAWVNTVLGETWVERGEAPDWQRLYERAENYRISTVPYGGVFLTAGCDVQKDRLEVEVVAWGKNKESWSVEYKIIEGDSAKTATWNELSKLLEKKYPCEDGEYRSISMIAVDAGYATQEVYAWVRKKPRNRVMAIKGVDKTLVPLSRPRDLDSNIRGKTVKNGAKIRLVGVSILKEELYSDLNLAKDENGFPRGYCHFPASAPEYFKQLTAEQLVTKTIKGYARTEWQKTRARNEALDCRIYAKAAAIAYETDRWTESKWDSLMGSVRIDLSGIDVGESANQDQATPVAPKKKSIVSDYPPRPRKRYWNVDLYSHKERIPPYSGGFC